MFEDIKKNDQQLTSGKPPEDMFANTDPTAAETSKPALAAQPSALDSGKIQPIGAPPVGPTQPLTNLDQLTEQYEQPQSTSFIKKLLLWLVSVVVIVGLGFGGWFVYATYLAPLAKKTDQSANTNRNNNNAPVNTNFQPVAPNNPTDVAASSTTPVIDQDGDDLSDVEENLLQTDPNNADTDKDGLTDYEEVKLYFTDPLSPDTDNDGLSDREEIFTWKTNPKSADSDGDGFQDGEEIRNGYNPNGQGKLIPPETLPVTNQPVK